MTSLQTLLCISPLHIVANPSTDARLPLKTKSFFSSTFLAKTHAGSFGVAISARASSDFKTKCIEDKQWPDNAVTTVEQKERRTKVSGWNEIKQQREVIRKILLSIDDGNLSVSAYDTAWVALVKDINGLDAPQFPESLQWIINNQLPDGSWGDRYFFSPYDRLSCTLACVVALRTWNLCPEKCDKGISFLQQNLDNIKDEDPEHMPSGFEVRFPTLINMAQNLCLEISEDSEVLQYLCALREMKLKRIPMEVLHNVSTTLLYSLEGMPGLNWEKLLKLQHPNGSFLCSTGSTAYALDQCKDEKCLKYIKDIVKRFNGGVPHTYPVDLFERLWVVDRLERLGFSRYFKSEIKECLDHVYRYWTPNGISWSRNNLELDIDDTSMGFRMLRLHGYEVNASAYHHFEKDGQFFCFVGQNSQGVTEMLSLYRASQILFPGEKILEEAQNFAFNFLRDKQDLEQVADRWLIAKDLVGEVRYYMDVPWYASLPRLETRYYIDMYGGDDDVWVGKVLYRMYNVSKNLFLEFAKSDYNHCQKLHQMEWTDIQRWYKDLNLIDTGLSKDELLKAYFLAMSNIFEPERATERLAWSKTASLSKAVSSYFKSISSEQKRDFIQAFINSDSHINNSKSGCKGTKENIIKAILKTMSDLSLKVREVHGKEVYYKLKEVWNAWMLSAETQKDGHFGYKNEAELLVCTTNLCSGHYFSPDLSTQPDFIHLVNLTNEICNHLQIRNIKAGKKENWIEEMNLPMQELVQHVVKSNDGVDREIKQTFLDVAKSYYYTAFCEPATVEHHISKVLLTEIV